jgi:hypothetical protein
VDKAFLRVKNWDSFQQYKDREPFWIKLHRSILTDYEFDQLTDVQQIHLIKIWLLAAKLNNQIPDDAVWIGRQIGARSKVDVKQMVTYGFLEQYSNVHECTDSYVEKEKEQSKRKSKKIHWSNDFDRWWRKYPKKVARKPCRAKWRILKPDPDVLVKDVQTRLLHDDQWKKGFIPNPLTYLNQERWNDDISQPKPADIPAADRVLQQAAEYLRNETHDDPLMDENDSSFRITMD